MHRMADAVRGGRLSAAAAGVTASFSVLAGTLLAGTVLAATVVTGTPASALTARSPAARATPPATAKPSPHPSATASRRATPPARHQGKPAAPAGPPRPVPGMPQPSANCPPQTGQARLTGEPWAQPALGFTSVWDRSRGQGVTVAVIDSGVDYLPQLAGRVSWISETGTGPQDCVGHGTAVASIIAAADARARGVPFLGVAPAARILSVKVASGFNGSMSVSPALLARGIHDAAAEGAQVINVSVQSASTAALRAAVAYAQHRNAVIVAAAGNDTQTSGPGPFYPASYPGVLAVGAVDQSGTIASFSNTRTPVSVTAPGVGIAVGWPGGFNPSEQGTSFATPFVSGEAALVRAAFPWLTAAQVVHRIEATADGPAGVHTGAGMINPVQAVTALPRYRGAPARPHRVFVPGPPRADPFTRTAAIAVTAGASGAAGLVVLGAVVLPAGRRRRWRAAPAGQDGYRSPAGADQGGEEAPAALTKAVWTSLPADRRPAR